MSQLLCKQVAQAAKAAPKGRRRRRLSRRREGDATQEGVARRREHRVGKHARHLSQHRTALVSFA